MLFVFLGRVSTEDQQDPESSRAWQLGRAKALIVPRGGVIVAEYFDIGQSRSLPWQSRSLPWQRRPRASALLAALRDANRGFDAVVIGEPHRAFYGNQFGLTFPLFVHYGVHLWVPEVGGALDPDNEAHDLVMSVFGGMSKGERNRIRVRVRTAMAAQTRLDMLAMLTAGSVKRVSFRLWHNSVITRNGLRAPSEPQPRPCQRRHHDRPHNQVSDAEHHDDDRAPPVERSGLGEDVVAAAGVPGAQSVADLRAGRYALAHPYRLPDDGAVVTAELPVPGADSVARLPLEHERARVTAAVRRGPRRADVPDREDDRDNGDDGNQEAPEDEAQSQLAAHPPTMPIGGTRWRRRTTLVAVSRPRS
jgi:hypothetical protein